MPRILLLLSGVLFAQSCLAQNPGTLLVVTKQSHALALVDGATLQKIAAIPIGDDPHEVVVAPDNRTAYVTNYQDASLSTFSASIWWRASRWSRSALPRCAGRTACGLTARRCGLRRAALTRLPRSTLQPAASARF
jgi:hypothetical protein